MEGGRLKGGFRENLVRADEKIGEQQLERKRENERECKKQGRNKDRERVKERARESLRVKRKTRKKAFRFISGTPDDCVQFPCVNSAHLTGYR